MTDANSERYSPPEDLVRKRRAQGTMRLDMCGFELFANPFGISFSNTRNPDEKLVHTQDSAFLMADKYMQLDFQLPSQRIYGLGERVREFTLGEGTWTMWANGQPTPYDDGMGSLQTYGVHPFALIQSASPGEYFGLYFRNSNAQSPVIKHGEGGKATLSYITTGGELEVYFFFKGTAKQIIQQYQQLVGLPSLPPFWALGWHAASYGYKDQAAVEENVNGYANASIPLEGVWLDIPYLDAYADFSVDATTFPSLKEFTEELHKRGKRMVVIVDAGLSADKLDNKYYRAAQDKKVLVQSLIHPDKFEGALSMHVWPNHTVFLDFFSEDAADVWGSGLKDLHELVAYDGLWLDMNEVTGFCNGECPDYGAPPSAHSGQTPSSEAAYAFLQQQEAGITNHTWYFSFEDQGEESTYKLPFIPGKVNLDNMSMSLNATHPSNGLKEYDVHSLFAMLEGKRTREFLLNATVSPHPGNRTFLLSRSSFAGSGQYA